MTHIKELSKQIFYKNHLLEETENITKTWVVINELLSQKKKKKKKKKKQSNKLMSCLMIDGKRYYDAQSIAQNLNNFFVSVGSRQCDSIVPTVSPLSFLKHRISNSVVFEETSPHEIFSLIARLSSKKSSDPDDISASILKSINYPVSHALS